MRTFATFLLLGLIFTSCNKPETVTPESLTGMWVEKTAQQDTLIFNPTFRGEILTNLILVNRGKTLNLSGDSIPRTGSGYWSYQVKADSILVVSSVSSSMRQSAYVFRRDGEQIVVGNFFELYQNRPATAVRTLVRLP